MVHIAVGKFLVRLLLVDLNGDMHLPWLNQVELSKTRPFPMKAAVQLTEHPGSG